MTLSTTIIPLQSKRNIKITLVQKKKKMIIPQTKRVCFREGILSVNNANWPEKSVDKTG